MIDIEHIRRKCLFIFLRNNDASLWFQFPYSDDDECIECDAILESLEEIDDEADTFGIDFVKNNDPHAARQYNIYNTPALVYFRRMSPIVFDGDLMDGERILEWLTSQVFSRNKSFCHSICWIVGPDKCSAPINYIFDCQDVFETKDEIEEVNRKLLEKLLDENEFVAVYFCKFSSDYQPCRKFI